MDLLSWKEGAIGDRGAVKWRDQGRTSGPTIWQLVQAGGGESQARKARREAVDLGLSGKVAVCSEETLLVR